MKTDTQIIEKSINIFENILDKIPHKIILLDQDRVFYLNRSAANFLRIQNSINISNSFIDFIHADFKINILSKIGLIKNGDEITTAILCKIINYDEMVAEVELQISLLELFGKKFVLVIINEISSIKHDLIQNAILKILQADNSASSLEETCDYLYGIVKEIIDIKNFYVALFDKQTKSISFPYYCDQFSSKPLNRKFGNGLTEFVLTTKKTLLLNGKTLDKKINDGTIIPSKYSVKGWLGVPLFILEDIAGVIVIKEYEKEKFLDENIKQIIELVSFPISRVIERKIIDQARKDYTLKLQELNNSKDKFFSIISHDLKSPFNSILGFTEILKDQNATLDKEELNEIYEALNNSAKKTFNLLNNLLQYSKFQSGLGDFNPSKINLSDLIKENLILFEGTAAKKQIKIINNSNENFLIYADKEMLNSILRNLINNAIKYSNPGGKIFIYYARAGDFVEISVKDSGVGMDQETVDNLFKIESKTSKLGTNKEEGTGLGLILAKEFVEKNGGKIFVKSAIGIGTEFTFTVKSINIKSNIVENSLIKIKFDE